MSRSANRNCPTDFVWAESEPFTVLHCPCQKCPSIRTDVFSAAQRCESRGDRDESHLPCENYSRLSVPAEKTCLFIKSVNKTEFPLFLERGSRLEFSLYERFIERAWALAEQGCQTPVSGNGGGIGVQGLLVAKV